MKFAVSSYSFQQYLRDGRMTQLDCVLKAKEMGFDAIEFTDLQPPEGASEEEYAQQIAQECKKVGLTVSNYTVFADFLANDPKTEAQRLMKKVDVAQILGSTSMRHDAAWGFGSDRANRGLQNVVERLADGCRMVTEYAAQKGIRTMVENHGFFLQDADRVEKLINTVNHPNFGWLCDMGNFLCADEGPAKSCGKAAPYVFYVHAKDFIVKSGNEPNPGEGFFSSRAGNYLRGTIIGHGMVPVKQCLRVLTPMFSTMQILKDNMKKAALKGFINATDCADYLTKKGMPFRDAYKTVGQLVAQCVREDKSLADLTLEEYKTHSDAFENDVYEAIDLKTCVRGRKVIGGPAPEEVTRQILVIEKFVSEHETV